jgi:signal transduction histidine kinase
VSDALIVAAAVVLTCGPLVAHHGMRAPGAPQWSATARLVVLGLALLGCAALAVRRRWPFPVLAVTTATVLGAAPITASTKLTAIPGIVALYTVAAHRDWPAWLAAGALAGSVGVVAELIGGTSPAATMNGLIWVVAPVAIGVAVRNRRQYVAAIEERARQAEATMQDETRRRVAEERIRIARELHDVLAHTIAVISIQSGVAAHLIHRQPAKAQQALWHINDASHAALAELRTTIGVLRDDDEPTAPTRPLPDLSQLEELVEQVRATGLTVRTHLSGDLNRMPAEVGLVGYRVLQEALTNVLKHAHAGTVEVTATADGRALHLDVRDDGIGTDLPANTDPPAGTGHGRIGMRERVHAIGGVLQDGPARPGYRVRAVIPLTTLPKGTA